MNLEKVVKWYLGIVFFFVNKIEEFECEDIYRSYVMIREE